MGHLIILRGLPGSGKTSFANLLNVKAICCADDWHYRGGEYRWDFDNVGKAHNWCQKKCERFMKINTPKVIVANTNTTEKEMEPYYNLAEKYGYKVFSVIVENRHGGANIHDVPHTTIEKMKNRFHISL